MLRFFEPEAEPRWPVSSDPPEHHQLLQLLKLSGMRNDTLLPLSSSLLTSSLGSYNEDGERGPNFFTELERFNNFNGDHLVNLISTSQDYSSFHLAALNQLQGQASLDHNPTGFRVPGLTSRQLDVMNESKKAKKHIKRDSKRLKAAYYDNHQTPTYYELNTVATLTKVPLTGRRSQKLGDKITALQQLVSPFGKTDTASVLQEACVYIKVLHEQIRVLSSPYFGTKASPCFQGNGGEKLALRANGLCLVPISSTIMNLTNQESFNHRTLEQTRETTGVRLH